MEYNQTITTRYSAQLPNLAAAFSEARAIAPEHRLAWTKEQRKNIFRDGWFINTPVTTRGDSESVEDHVQHLTGLIHRYFPKNIQDQAIKIAEGHDDHEVIAHAVIDGIKRDLNPAFNKNSYVISSDDKKAIEAMARAVLYETEPALKHLLDTYPDSSDDAALAFRELDKICVMWRCADFVESGKYRPSDFQAYWDFWTPDNVRKKCTSFMADIYESELWPRVQKFTL